MFWLTHPLREEKGLSLVEVTIGVALLAGATGLIMSTSSNLEKTKVAAEKVNEFHVLKDYILAKTAYTQGCMLSMASSTPDLNNIINNKKGSLAIHGPQGSLIKNGSHITGFDLNIEDLEVRDLVLAKSAYGFSFYTGELFLTVTLGTKRHRESLGSMNFLVDNAGLVTACSSREDLQKDASFIAAKN